MTARDHHIRYLAASVLYYRQLDKNLRGFFGKPTRYAKRAEEYESRVRQLADNLILDRTYAEVSRTLVG